LALIIPGGEKISLLKHTKSLPELTEQEVREVGDGKVLIKVVSDPESTGSHLRMAVNLVEHHPEAGILIGELNPELLWDAEDYEPNYLWVMDDTGHLLFSSKPGFELPPEIRTMVSQGPSGQFSWKSGASAYAGAYWKIPLKIHFYAPDIIIVQGQPTALAFRSVRQFTAIYPPVIVLAVLIVAYLSTRLISKYLTPLERLKAATVKIAEGDFNCRVQIDSHDEFEDLADSFNAMTHRLRNQFDVLSTMAEIDRSILSSLNAEDIVEIALRRLPSILACDLISIAKIDPDTSLLSDIRTRRTGQSVVNSAGPISLSQRDIADLLDRQNSAIEISFGGQMMDYLQTLDGSDQWRYLIIPIMVNGILTSMICLGYQAPHTISPQSRSAARNFGDRITVALSNAAWEEKLYRQAHYDSLTGLPNRLTLHDRLAQELPRAKRNDTQFAVLFIDLDRFKNVNDSLGHAAGDELLMQVAGIFVDTVRATDLVVRIGGDEFVIVITDLHAQQSPMLFVSAIAQKILAALNQTLIVAGHALTFTASIGIAIFPGDADNIQDLLKNADAAMYHAKSEGRANFRFYSPELNAAALENMKLEHDLRVAIAKGEFIVYYQPKVDWARHIVGAEALLRWQHPKLGIISPTKFIPLAEQAGLIGEIGRWVLEQACLVVNSCQSRGITPVRISVNLSAAEFKYPRLVENIAGVLAGTGVDTSFIELELTESVAIGEIRACIRRMNDLKALGLKLAMDDFGTGYSSLSYLKELPLDVLKIDQSFVRQFESKHSSQAIVKAILALANGLGMETVAEGIETEAQLEFLKRYQCGVFQGYLFGHPLPAEDFLKLLADDRLTDTSNQ
jgi:diguanylate cyclase (GGDEF)-like protein